MENKEKSVHYLTQKIMEDFKNSLAYKELYEEIQVGYKYKFTFTN